MKSKQLFYVAEFLMVQELRMFEERITTIFNELTKELDDNSPDVVLQVISDLARERFNEYYPDEPFFEAIFNLNKTFFENFYKYDEIEEEQSRKASEKLIDRRNEDAFIYR
jgi:TRAP-type mannitol/chloroaromatic compound transport system substrate-binding protein